MRKPHCLLTRIRPIYTRKVVLVGEREEGMKFVGTCRNVS